MTDRNRGAYKSAPDISVPVVLRTDTTTVVVHPDCGMLVSSFRELESGAEAIWMNGQPAKMQGGVGAGGSISTDSFLDFFVGGWFPMAPFVGFPAPNDESSHLHGIALRLPWSITELSDSEITATLILSNGLVLTRSLRLAGSTLRVDTIIRNSAIVSLPVCWGEHPCFDLSTFESGRLFASVFEARVPSPPLDPETASLTPTETIQWPVASGTEGNVYRVSDVGDPRWAGQDHLELTLLDGSARLSAPRFDRVLNIAWGVAAWPHVLLWRRQREPGHPDNVFAFEPASVPGRGASERGSVPRMAPEEQWDSWISLSWTAGDDETVGVERD